MPGWTAVTSSCEVLFSPGDGCPRRVIEGLRRGDQRLPPPRRRPAGQGCLQREVPREVGDFVLTVTKSAGRIENRRPGEHERPRRRCGREVLPQAEGVASGTRHLRMDGPGIPGVGTAGRTHSRESVPQQPQTVCAGSRGTPLRRAASLPPISIFQSTAKRGKSQGRGPAMDWRSRRRTGERRSDRSACGDVPRPPRRSSSNSRGRIYCVVGSRSHVIRPPPGPGDGFTTVRRRERPRLVVGVDIDRDSRTIVEVKGKHTGFQRLAPDDRRVEERQTISSAKAPTCSGSTVTSRTRARSH